MTEQGPTEEEVLAAWIEAPERSPTSSHVRAMLAAAEPLTRARLFTCWYSNCDNIVFPARTAALPGARQRFVAGLAHVEMACDEQVMAECLEEMAQAN